MSTDTTRPVGVIIPAHDAAQSIGIAVRSALDQSAVGEVIVVDDASHDDTPAQALAAAKGDPRLVLLQLDRNVGPARARNLAIARGTTPLIALLDADDYFLPDRFAPLLKEANWDIVADNIVFVPESRASILLSSEVDKPTSPATTSVGIAEFLRGNIPDKNAQRGELGFLKPLMSRDFLRSHGLAYDPDLRLGEDFKLYVQMLAKGARFRLMPQIGYVARVRQNSLSGRHSARDLLCLLNASESLRASCQNTEAEAQAMKDYLRALRSRQLLHAFLETKWEQGLVQAARQAVMPPRNLFPIVRGILRDKMEAFSGKPAALMPDKRYLLPIE